MTEEQPTTRREFLRSLARGAALAGLTLGGGWLLLRSDRCVNGYVCQGCPLFADCTLPEKVGVAQASRPASGTEGTQAGKPALPGGDK